MSRKASGLSGVFFSRDLLSSKAYAELSAAAIRMLNQFYLKRQLIDSNSAQKLRIRSDSADMVRNNGKITFRYSEAPGKCGIRSNDTFTRCIDKLIAVGFIDLTHEGGSNDSSLYAISDRWRDYGKPSFKKQEREKMKNLIIGKSTRFKKNVCGEKTLVKEQNT